MRSILLSVLLLGCAKKTPGTAPHDMSTATHEAAAAASEASAEAHATQYSPDAATLEERCKPPGRGVPYHVGCWTEVVNPTEAHLAMAAKDQQIAAEHRAASEALRAAEASACVGLADADRDTSPFERAADIASVAALTDPSGPKGGTPVTMGAVVTFRAVPGMTAEWLQRIVDCHLARNAALGHEAPNMPDCPLVPKGATATVSSTGAGFAVAVRAQDPATGAEILARAQRLAPTAP